MIEYAKKVDALIRLGFHGIPSVRHVIHKWGVGIDDWQWSQLLAWNLYSARYAKWSEGVVFC